MKKSILFFFSISFTLFAQSQVSKTVNLTTAGTLSSSLTYNELNTVTDLTITGKIDARDFLTMRDKALALTIINLSGSTIIAYNGTLGTSFNQNNTSYLDNTISDFAFYGCTRLVSITIPSSVTSIGEYAFNGCSGLTGTLTIPSFVRFIGNYAYLGCKGFTGTLNIPSTVTSIGLASFYGCSGLTGTLNIPGAVTSISLAAFEGCTGITEFVVQTNNSNYSSINGVLFNYDQTYLIKYPSTKKGMYSVPNSVTSIGDGAFESCIGLNSITIPGSVTSIENYAFMGCTGLTSITIPNSVNSIASEAFSGCNGLTQFVVQTNNSNYSAIDGVLFYRNQTDLIQYPTAKQGNYTIPNSVKYIEGYAFYNCTGLKGSLTIPDSVTYISSKTFYGCTGLTGSLIIPSSVTYIFYQAFYGCSGLTSIYANSTLPIDLSTSDSVFYKVNKTTCTLYVPFGSKSAYQVADQWKDFVHIVEMATTAIPTITNSTISLYPNPTTDYFQVNGIDANTLITIKDLNGKTLIIKQINFSDKININSFSKGIYMIEVNTNKGLIIKKIIKN